MRLILFILLVGGCTCERPQKKSPSEQPALASPPARSPAPTLAPASPPAPVGPHFIVPVEKQDDIEKLLLPYKVGQEIVSGFKVGKPRILGERVDFPIEKADSAVMVMCVHKGVEAATAEASESFQIRLGSVSVDWADVQRVSRPVIDAIKQNDRGGLWVEAP